MFQHQELRTKNVFAYDFLMVWPKTMQLVSLDSRWQADIQMSERTQNILERCLLVVKIYNEMYKHVGSVSL